MNLLKLEFLKLRRTLVWPVTFLLPLIPAVLDAFIFRAERFKGAEWSDMLNNGLTTWWLLMMPLVLSLLVAWVLGSEHMGGGWQLSFAAPRLRREIMLGKLITILVMSLLMMTLLLLSVGVGAATLPHLTSQPDWLAFVQAGLRGWLGETGVLSLLFWVGLRFPSFLMPLGLGMAGTITGFMGINSKEFGPWWPWTFPTLFAIPDIQGKDLMLPSLFSLALTAIFLFASFWEMERRDA